MNKDMATAATKPKEELKTPEQLEAQKHYLELRQDYARIEEDRRALGTLFAYNSEEMNDGLLEAKKAKADQLHQELNALEANPALPKKFINTDTFDEEFFDRELNKVRENLGEPIPEPKAKYTKALRDAEREMIKNNFPMGLFPRGDKVKYEGDEWIVAGYDGYTGRGILKRDVEGGEVEYIFAERVPLYLENRIKSQDLVKSGSAPTEVASESGLNPQACIEMVGDDNFDYERAQAEQDARQPEKLGSKFKSWVKEKYEKVKKEIGSLPQDIRDVIETGREPFKATTKDINKDLTKGAEKFDRWVRDRQQAFKEAGVYMKLANEFRAVTEKVGADLSDTLFKDFEFKNERDLIKWAESGYDPNMLNDEQLYEVYNYLNTEMGKQGLMPGDDVTTENKIKFFDSVFQPGIEEVIKRNTELQDAIVESVVTELSNALEYYQSDTATLEDMEVRLTQFREELNKELAKIREGRVSMDKKKMIQFIRDALDKDYLSGYVYAPLKAFQSRPGKFSKSENPDNEIFEI